MLLNTQGIVLHTVNYSETSVVAKIFTRQLGERSYLVKGVNKARSRTKRNLLQPLSYLDMTVYDNNRRQLQYIKEMQPARQLTRCVTDSAKTSILFFMNEVLYKTIKEEEPNPQLFDYVVRQMEHLDATNEPLGNYPILFLLRLSRYLGIEPRNNYSRQEPCFQLHEGRFLAPPTRWTDPRDLDYYLEEGVSVVLHHFLEAAYCDTPCPILGAEKRRALTDTLVQYYRVHLPDFFNLKSADILHTVLN